MAGRMSLANVTKGRIKRPARALVYGPEGVGKSTFGAGAPNPIFLCRGRGTEELNVSRLPEPETWEEAKEGLYNLSTDKHDYQSIVIDPVDWLEPMLYTYVLTKVKTLTDDFSAGYALAREQWRLFIAALDKVHIERNMHVIILAHAEIKEFKNPSGPDYDQWRIALQEKSSAMFRQWVSDVLFVTFETFAAKDKGARAAKGVSTGKRVAYTEFRAGWYAKNRHGMPPQIDWPPNAWAMFEEYLNRDIESDSKLLREQVVKLSDQIKDKETREKAQAYIARQNLTIEELRAALTRVETLVYEQGEKKEGMNDG